MKYLHIYYTSVHRVRKKAGKRRKTFLHADSISFSQWKKATLPIHLKLHITTIAVDEDEDDEDHCSRTDQDDHKSFRVLFAFRSWP